MKDSNKSLLWGALIGSVVGSVTALLLAPKSGRELRQDITEGARQVTDKGQELAVKVGEQSSQIVSKVKETADVVIKDIQSWRCSSDGKEIRISAAIADTDQAEEVQGHVQPEIQVQEQAEGSAQTQGLKLVSSEQGAENIVKLTTDESKDEKLSNVGSAGFPRFSGKPALLCVHALQDNRSYVLKFEPGDEIG